MSQQENQGMHVELRKFVLPRFNGSPAHFRSSQNIGFVCLDSGEQVCKPADWKMIAKWGSKVPNGTIAVFLPADLFKVPASNTTDLSGGIFESEVLKYASWTGYLEHASPNSIIVKYVFRTEKFIAGLVLRLGGEGNLTGDKTRINNNLNIANQLNKKAMLALKKLPPLPTIPPPAPRNGMSHPMLPIAMQNVSPLEHRLDIPYPAPFEFKKMLYSTYCFVTMVSQFAWLTDDFNVDIYTFDCHSKARWYPIQCEECLLQVQRAVRALGITQPFTTGEDLPELQLRPPAMPILNINFPKRMPFDEKKQFLCRYKTDDMPGFYCFIVGWDNVITPYTYDGDETFTVGIPEGPMQIMKEHTKKRNLAYFVFREDVEKLKLKVPETLAMMTVMLAKEHGLKVVPKADGVDYLTNQFRLYGHLPLAFTQNEEFKVFYSVVQKANESRDYDDKITEEMVGVLIWRAMLKKLTDDE